MVGFGGLGLLQLEGIAISYTYLYHGFGWGAHVDVPIISTQAVRSTSLVALYFQCVVAQAALRVCRRDSTSLM